MALEQVLPAIEADHVSLWQAQPCRAMETPTGAYRDSVPLLGCGPDVFDKEPGPFDDQADAVFARVAEAFVDVGATPPESGWFYYGSFADRDRLISAIFWYGLADSDACLQTTLNWDLRPRGLDEPEEPDETTIPIADGWTWQEVECG
jgi:hypothetical protein